MTHTIENEYIKVSAEEFGAQLASFYSKQTGVEYLWQGDPKYWKGRAYNLFPTIGRQYQGYYLAGGKPYSLDCHGLARYYPFTLFEKTATSLTLLFRSNAETLKKYPYEFSFFVTFKIEGKKLTVEYTAKNEGKEVMYYGVGGHPGINVPFDGGAFEDYYLQFDKATPAVRHVMSESKFMSGEIQPYPLVDGTKLPLRHDLFDGDAVVFGNTCGTCYLKGNHTARMVKMEYPSYPYLGVWHMDKTDAPYVCLEPWSALPASEGSVDVLEQKADMVPLAVGESKTSVYTLEIFE